MFDIKVVTRHVKAACEAMQWGTDDCCMFVRNIVLDCGGPDLMAGIPKYRNEKQGKMLLARKGGVLRMVMRQAKKVGAKETNKPFPNDAKLVGVVPTKHGPALALRVNGAWFVRAQYGIVTHKDDMCVIAWDVTNA